MIELLDKTVTAHGGPGRWNELTSIRATLQSPWDHRHASYFGGYAPWTCLTVPFVLTQPGFAVRETDPWPPPNRS